MRNKSEVLRNPGLVELPFCFTVSPEYIDANMHMNNASYLRAYEDARSAYFLEASGMTMEKAGVEWGIMSVLTDLRMQFKRPLLEGDRATVYTSAEPTGPVINFYQRIEKDDIIINMFNGRIGLIDVIGAKLIWRMPPHVREVFDRLNSQG